MTIKFRRILLKLSGEALMGSSTDLYDQDTISHIAQEIKALSQMGIEIAITIGGGNIFRGINAEAFGLERSNADSMGMLATIINGIALKDFLANHGLSCKLLSALSVGNMIEGYNRERAMHALEHKQIIILAGGTGNPYFSTDSTAALRALEIKADLIIKATKVDGVYDKDPFKYPDARKYSTISFAEAIQKNLKVMDLTAFDLCKEHKINIEVCNVFQKNALTDSVTGNSQGTLIYA